MTVAKDRRRTCQSLSCCALGVGLRTSLPILFFFSLFEYSVCGLTHLPQGRLSIPAQPALPAWEAVNLP